MSLTCPTRFGLLFSIVLTLAIWAVSATQSAWALYTPANHTTSLIHFNSSEYDHMNKAGKALQVNNTAIATSELQAAIECNPTNRLVLFRLATLQEEHRQQLQLTGLDLEATYERLFSLDPDLHDVAFRIGRLAHQRGDREKAIDWYEESLLIKPEQPITHFNLASVFDDLNELDEAKRHYQQAIQLNKNLPFAHNNLGLLFEAQGERDQAEKAYHAALAVDPHYGYAHLNLGNFYIADKQWDKALLHFEETAKHPALTLMSLLGRGQAHYALGDYQASADAYEALSAQLPNELIPLYRLALCHFQLNHTQQALAYAKQAIQLAKGTPQETELRVIISLVEAQLGHTKVTALR